MNRTDSLLQKFAAAIAKAIPLAVVSTCFIVAMGPVRAQSMCEGGSQILDSSGKFAGCAFTDWGTNAQAWCRNMTVFAGSDPSNCHICVTPPYDTKIADGDYTGFTVRPTGSAKSPPTSLTCVKCAQAPPGLTAWWRLDETSATVHDSMNNLANNGLRLGGAAAVPGEVANATHFSGNGAYIEIPHDPQLDVPAGSPAGDGNFSLDAWVKVESEPDLAGVRVIAEKRTQHGSHYKGYSFYLYNGYLGLQLADDGAGQGYTNYGAPSLVVKPGAWHFVAISVWRSPSAAGIQFTLDNATVNIAGPIRGGDLSNLSPFRIGMRTIDSGGAFKGSIDEVEFFGRAVKAKEFEGIYNSKSCGKCGPPKAAPQGMYVFKCAGATFGTDYGLCASNSFESWWFDMPDCDMAKKFCTAFKGTYSLPYL